MAARPAAAPQLAVYFILDIVLNITFSSHDRLLSAGRLGPRLRKLHSVPKLLKIDSADFYLTLGPIRLSRLDTIDTSTSEQQH